jgi:hypothetical protein
VTEIRVREVSNGALSFPDSFKEVKGLAKEARGRRNAQELLKKVAKKCFLRRVLKHQPQGLMMPQLSIYNQIWLLLTPLYLNSSQMRMSRRPAETCHVMSCTPTALPLESLKKSGSASFGMMKWKSGFRSWNMEPSAGSRGL